MKTLVESLQRLYKAEKVKKEQLDALLASKKITKEEYEFITTREG